MCGVGFIEETVYSRFLTIYSRFLLFEFSPLLFVQFAAFESGFQRDALIFYSMGNEAVS